MSMLKTTTALCRSVCRARGPATSYTAILVSPGGTTTKLGTVPTTDKHGNARLIVPTEFAASTIGSGSVVLQSGATNEFVSGFKVNEKFVLRQFRCRIWLNAAL